MADFFLVKQLGALRPTDAAGEELLQSIRNGGIVRAKISRPRNAKHHRRFFALVGLLSENSTYTTDQILHLLKMATGHFDVVVTRRGEERVPRSISFAKMDEKQFSDFEARCFDYIAAEIIPGISKDALLREVSELVGLSHGVERAA